MNRPSELIFCLCQVLAAIELVIEKCPKFPQLSSEHFCTFGVDVSTPFFSSHFKLVKAFFLLNRNIFPGLVNVPFSSFQRFAFGPCGDLVANGSDAGLHHWRNFFRDTGCGVINASNLHFLI